MSVELTLTRIRNTESQMELAAPGSESGKSRKKDGCSTSMKLLAFITLAALIVAVAACIAIAIVVNQGGEMTSDAPSTTKAPMVTVKEIEENNEVCTTRDCVLTAARILQSVDKSIHPCDNFYEFACNQYLKKNPIPENMGEIGTVSLLGEQLIITLRELLETPSGEDELEAVTRIKNYYRSCINETLIEERGIQPVQSLFNLFGPWPLLNNTWDEADFDLVDMLITLRQYGSKPLINTRIAVNPLDSTKTFIQLDQPGLMMPSREYYLSNRGAVAALRKYITEVAKSLGATNLTQLEQDVSDIMEFEINVANLTIKAEDRRGVSSLFNPMTIAELTTKVSDKFDWFRFLRGIMDLPGVQINITENETVNALAVVYLRNVIDLISQTPPRTVVNYIMAIQVMSMIPTLPGHFRDLDLDYTQSLLGSRIESPRWRTCVGEIQGTMGEAIGRLYVDQKFDEETKRLILEMITKVREVFSERFDDVDWMDADTRKVAKEKADAITESVGYSEKLKNDTYLNDAYKMMAHFPSNIKRILSAYKQQNVSVNFGGIGTGIGHEITHGFDDIGRRFDKNGAFTKWWSDQVIKKFQEKTRCMVEQYGNYIVPEANMKLNGINTLGENIADNGGILSAYEAYREWVKKQGKEEPRLPAIDYNNNQLFFISYAQIWCRALRPGLALAYVLTDNHSDNRFRVIGPLQNSKEFSEVFNCPTLSYMNPVKKCRVW